MKRSGDRSNIAHGPSDALTEMATRNSRIAITLPRLLGNVDHALGRLSCERRTVNHFESSLSTRQGNSLD